MERCFKLIRDKWPVCGGLFWIVSNATPAMANNPPEPPVFFAEIAILPLMIVCSIIGGYYAIISAREEQQSPKLGKIIGVIVIIFFSGIHEGVAMLVAIGFGCIAIGRGFQMLHLGLSTFWKGRDPAYGQIASPWRLLPAGAALILLAIFFAGIGIAFQSHIGGVPGMERYRVQRFKDFVAYQMAYAQISEQTNGRPRFHQSSGEDPYPWQFQSNFSNDQFFNLQTDFDDSNQQFTVYLLPKLPFFPYNYLTAAPSYRGDGTGRIRMIRVHDQNQRCPVDAPVVMRIDSQEIEQMKKVILTERARVKNKNGSG